MKDEANGYYNWLISLVDWGEAKFYNRLLDKLYEEPFIWHISNDDNREIDGLNLRERYAFEVMTYGANSIYDVDSGCCSILEMMIALACRMEDILYDPDYGDQVPKWFWIMIENLGLNVYDDYHFNERDVEDICERFNEREFSRSGKGGLFRTNDATFDMRKVEIWYQMMHFINEFFK